MKKPYISPIAKFYPLSGSSFGSCTQQSTAGEYSCGVAVPGLGETIFTEGNCDTYGDSGSGVCYMVPTDDWRILSS